MSELPLMMKIQVNGLAQLFYKMQGKVVEDMYDFSKATHPEEYGLWNQALVAYAYINNDSELLKHQVGKY